MAKDHAYEQVLCMYVVYRLVALMIAVVVANRVSLGITCVEVHRDSGLRIYKANHLVRREGARVGRCTTLRPTVPGCRVRRAYAGVIGSFIS